MTGAFLGEVARGVLARARLARFVDAEGVPTDECWAYLETGTLSSGERVMVAFALAILDYSMAEPVRVSDLMRLDNANLRVVGEALLALANHR